MLSRFPALLGQYPRLLIDAKKRREIPVPQPHYGERKDPETGASFYRLKKPSVWFVNMQNPTLFNWAPKTHGYAIVGNPGQGKKSGAVVYGVSPDPKRGGVHINDEFLKKVHTRVNSEPISSALKKGKGKKYKSKESFFEDYKKTRQEQNPTITDERVLKEFKKICFSLPKKQMELWPLTPNGRSSEPPNISEKDIRGFENVKGVEQITKKAFEKLSEAERTSGNVLAFENISLRQLPSADPISLLEKKRQWLLNRLYLDESYERNGTLLPSKIDANDMPVSKHRKKVMGIAPKLTPTFQKLPPYTSNKEANCNSATASLLDAAMESKPNSRKKDLKPADPLAFGFYHRIQLWNPLKNNHQRPLEENSNRATQHSASSIDTRSARGRDIDITPLIRMLEKRAAGYKAPPQA